MEYRSDDIAVVVKVLHMIVLGKNVPDRDGTQPSFRRFFWQGPCHQRWYWIANVIATPRPVTLPSSCVLSELLAWMAEWVRYLFAKITAPGDVGSSNAAATAGAPPASTVAFGIRHRHAPMEFILLIDHQISPKGIVLIRITGLGLIRYFSNLSGQGVNGPRFASRHDGEQESDDTQK